MSTQDGTGSNTGFTQDDALASVEAITTDLNEVIDPYRLEVPLAIDDQGHFLAWMDAENRIASLPSDQARADLSGFTTQITQDGFKRYTPKAVDAAEAIAFHPTSAAIDAVFAELEASAKGHVAGVPEPKHEQDPAFEVEAQAETGFNHRAELEAGPPNSQIDPLALEDSFEQVAFDTPALSGEQAAPLELEAAVEQTQTNLNPAESAFGLESTELEAMLAAINSEPEFQDAVSDTNPKPNQMVIYEMEGVPVTNLNQQLERHMLETATVEPVVAASNEHTETMHLPMLPATTLIRRHFDATNLIEAQQRLQQVLHPLEVSMLALLARAAERCSLELPNINSIALAELTGHGVAISAEVKAVESFREMLAGIAQGSGGANADLRVLDIRDLGLSETILRLAGVNLLLTQLSPHPDKPGRTRATISLCGLERAHAGAAFLEKVVSKLEAPITLMV
jgi:hypothetical protein